MSSRQRDERSGRFKKGYEDSDFIEAVEQIRHPTLDRVSEKVGCARSTAHDRLQDLEDQGILTRFEIGDSHLWAVKNEVDSYEEV